MSIYYLRMRNATIANSSVLHYGYMTGTEVRDELKHCTRSYAQKQEEVVAYETVLPDHAPDAFRDPEKLWNSVQEYEMLHGKGNARTYKDFVIALPVELSQDEQIQAARSFAEKLRSDGMCVSWAIHDPHKKTANPHIHVMASIRPLDKKGQWSTKEKKVYVLDADGNKVPEIDKKTGLQKEEIRRKKLADGTIKEYRRKVWKREVIDGSGFDRKEKLQEWKKAWEEIVNPFLEVDKKVDCRSYKDQGVLKISEIHEGYYERKMDAMGLSDICEENRTIRLENEQINTLKRQIFKTIDEIKELFKEVKKYVYRSGAFTEGYEGSAGDIRDDRSLEKDGRSPGETESGTGDDGRGKQEAEISESQIAEKIDALREGQESYAKRARELLERRAATIIGGVAGYMPTAAGGERAVQAGKEGLGEAIDRPEKKSKHKSIKL